MKLGILGGGQLARMIALAAHNLGIRTTVLDPSPDPCAGHVCGHIQGDYEDYRALYQLVQHADVVTYEFENVPGNTTQWLAERLPVFPPPRALEVSQDRVREKTFFNQLTIPTPGFRAIQTRDDYDMAIQEIGIPSVLKTCRFGYDGKGQTVLRTPADIDTAWAALGGRPLILEAFIPFSRELSTVAVRAKTGNTAFYPLVQNEHREGILHRTTAPAPLVTHELQNQANTYATRILNALDYVGVLAVEWFDVNGTLVANEMAPRVHNSGHWSIEGAGCSQFENHVRAVLGFPLGDSSVVAPCEMVNLIGERPDFETVLSNPRANLHWYGKEPKPRRKVGHVTTLIGQSSETRT
jgi:5-(carboxyamino)imidazole ribonucleotide synthase